MVFCLSRTGRTHRNHQRRIVDLSSELRTQSPHQKSIIQGIDSMGMITTKDGAEIFYKDWGRGPPIVFHHGWPLSSDDWDTQMLFFVQQGYRVVGIDRRGHGRS